MKRSADRFAFGLVLGLGWPVAIATGQQLVVPRVETRPVIDGVLDEPMWRQAAVLDQWVQTRPADNGRPHGETVAYLVYGPDALYLAIRARDEPGKIRYRLHERDNVVSQSQDWIGIQIDPFNDRRQAFTLAINPIGVQGDGLTIEGSGFQEWDAIFDAAGKVSATEYVIEVAIPFKSLRFPRRERGQRWGFALTRHYGRDNAEDSPWPRNRDLACDLCQMITLVGIGGIHSSRGLEVNPAIVGRLSAERPEIGLPFKPTETAAEIGLNLKYGWGPNLTLDGTYNPDFSQVESDAGQLQINNRFALFFPEKRPFFLEGTDIFLTRVGLPGQEFQSPPINLFYSRRIVDPTAGIKLTGKTGKLSVGLLGSVDADHGYDFGDGVAGLGPSDLDPFLGRHATVGVARMKLDVLEDGYVGATVTGRRFGDGYGLVGAVDSRLRIGRNAVIRVLGAHSETREATVTPYVFGRLRRALGDGSAYQAAVDSLSTDVTDLDGERVRGDAIQAQLDWTSRHWLFGLGYLDITPRFETALGFTPRVDQIQFAGQVAHVYRGTGFLRSLTSRIRFEETYEHGPSGGLGRFGAHTDRLISTTFDFSFPAGTDFSVGYTRAFLRFDEIDFPDLGRAFVYAASQAWPWLSWEVFIRGGEEAIFTDEVDGGPPLPDFFITPSVSATIRPIAPVRVALSIAAARVWRRTEQEHRASRYAESAIPRVRAQVQVTQRLGLRLIGEYRLERFFHVDGSIADRRENFSTSFLATYLVHPGQSLQLGWSTLARGDLDLPLATFARGGVAKVTYLWRL